VLASIQCDVVHLPIDDTLTVLSVGELGKVHTTKLFRATQGSDTVIAAVTRDEPGEGGPWQEIHELSEQGFAGVHRSIQESGFLEVCPKRRSPFKSTPPFIIFKSMPNMDFLEITTQLTGQQ